MARIVHSIMTAKKQRVLWLVIVSISIMVPLMIFKTNVSMVDFPLLQGVADWNLGSDAISVDGNGTQFLFNFSFDIGAAAIEALPQSAASAPAPQFHDFRQSNVSFNWCQPSSDSEKPSTLPPPTSGWDCDRLFAGDKEAIEKAKGWTPPCSYNDMDMSKIACDCSLLKNMFHFENESLSEEEYRYPLAFILVVEKNMEQIVRLLASIYQPQNLYCITYDEHSSREFKKAVRCLTSCFPNLIMPLRHLEIYWADISILDATLACMKRFVNGYKDHGWKYVQILSWNDLPLKTNLEMVRIFKILNGTSDSELSYGQPERFRKYHYQGGLDNTKTGVARPIPPDGLTMYKGSFAVSLPRELCNYIIHDPVAKALYAYSRPVWAPEEQFWSTLIHNLHLNHSATFPGACLHFYHMEGKSKEWISRFQIWNSGKCAGRMVSGSCCFGVGDLPMLKSNPGLIAHKFYSDFQPAVWYCMLKWNHDKTYNTTVAAANPLSVSFYQNLPPVRYQNTVHKSDFLC